MPSALQGSQRETAEKTERREERGGGSQALISVSCGVLTEQKREGPVAQEERALW